MDSQENSQIVLGIMHPHGVGGVASTNDNWTLVFSFCAWRDESNVIHNTVLHLKRELSHQELHEYMNRFKPYQILRVRLKLEGEYSASLLELLDENVATDNELNQTAAELQKPKSFEHKRFGIFVLDREIDWYEASVTWGDKPIKLHIYDDDVSMIDAAIQQAVTLWDNQLIWNQRVMDLVVLRYFNHKNNLWLEEDEEPVSISEFKSRLNLESITVDESGNLRFWFTDGDLFFGHWLEVTGNLDTGLQDVKLQG